MSASAVDLRRVEHGQFYTAVSPFGHPAFLDWFDRIPSDAVLLEPYAGANHIVEQVAAVRPGRRWVSYDIAPAHPAVAVRDTIADFPAGYDAVVTNPPYLAKNSATRQGLHAAAARMGGYDNLYKRCVADCLAAAGWAAAIIPEQFLTTGLWQTRLCAVVSLPARMFDDTDQPVCVAMWQPTPAADCLVWHGRQRLGSLAALLRYAPQLPSDAPTVRFNQRDGQLGLRAADGTQTASIRFVPAADIPVSAVKPSARFLVRIRVEGLDDADVPAVLTAANRLLSAWREASSDVGMTAFRGVRADGRFRRRLSFADARALIAAAVAEVRR